MEKMVLVICDNCNNPFMKPLRYTKRSLRNPRYKGRSFCNKICYGQWLGNNHGFKINIEHRLPTHKRKWNYDKVAELYKTSKLSQYKFSKLFNIPAVSLWRAIHNKNQLPANEK